MIARLSEVWPEVERIARDNGVVRLGASDLHDEHGALFDEWLDRGHQGTMQYLSRTRDTRRDPATRFPWAKSAIVILVPYSPMRPDAPANALSHRIARYALGDDYHVVLDQILRKIEPLVAAHGKTWRYVDTGPLSDRALATQAGLGWIAKNAMLINEQIGSYTFIGTLLTSLENDLAPDSVADRCGTCTRCIEACPTDAILPNRTVASERCISYATIEHRGELPDLPLAGNAFGCDICQEVCPWNHEPAAAHPAFEPRSEYRATPVTDLLRYEQTGFSTLFRKSAVKRAKLAGMKRNVAALTEQESRGMLKPYRIEHMTKDVTVEELQTNLQDHLADVEHGLTIRVLDGDEPIAEIGPSSLTDDDFFVHVPDPALGPLGAWKPPSLHLDWDPVPDLVAERDRHR